MQRQRQGLFRRLTDLFTLRTCLLCGAPCAHASGFCLACQQALPRLGPACRHCALPLTQAAAQCGQCQRRPPAYTHTYAPFRYAAPIDQLIVTLKYRQGLHLAHSFGVYMAQALTDAPRPQVIMPVPLHSSRLRQRGYNQALELARPIARALELPLEFRAARRRRATPSQTTLPAAARARNVRNAFAYARPCTYTHIAIVDDVMTSGQTANAFARCLLAAGAQRVDVWVLARA